MYRTANRKRVFGLVVTTALTGALLSGCTSAGFNPASLVGRSDTRSAQSQRSVAIQQAEAAVLADPRGPASRALLGSAYLDAGRFASAATSFGDAVQLGDNSARTMLSYSLALTAQGKLAEAAALLNAHEGDMAIADLGLALALAGQPERGVHLMGNAIRGGENTAKMRQNLAFAYALAGRWREARLMAEQDVPAAQLSDRIQQWAEMAQPGAWQQRVTALLSVPANVADSGQPVELALSNSPEAPQFADLGAADPIAAESELPAVASVAELAPAPVVAPLAEAPYQVAEPALPGKFQVAFAEPSLDVAGPAVTAQDGIEFVSTPMVQAAPARVAEAAPGRRPAAAQAAAPRVAQNEAGTHLIQLGSFTSEAAARRAWAVYANRYPELSGHRMVISEAVVRGKNYWRVSAAGFASTSAAATCGRIKSGGQGCFAYAEDRPLPGAVDRGTRLAQR